MIALTEQQQQILNESGWPPRLVNPGTGETFVMIPEAMFARLRTMLEEEDEIAAVEETYPLVNEALDDSTSRADT
jgi:hypothetical protein